MIPGVLFRLKEKMDVGSLLASSPGGLVVPNLTCQASALELPSLKTGSLRISAEDRLFGYPIN